MGDTNFSGPNYGKIINQTGQYASVTEINHGATTDPQALFREMLSAIQTLRGQVGPMDRQVIDESVAAVGSGQDVPPQQMHGALSRIAGIASIVGQVGAPVVEAIRKVMAAFGLA